MYTMKLNDGTVLENLKMGNGVLISSEALTEESLRGKLCPVTITGEQTEGEYDDFNGMTGFHEAMEVVFVRHGADGGTEIALAEADAEMLKYARLEARMEYIAMMTGVDK